MKKTILILITIIILISIYPDIGVNALVPYESYTYNFWGEKRSSPPAFIPSRIVTNVEMRTSALNNPTNIFISEDGTFLISDTDNNRVLILNSNLELEKEIKSVVHMENETFLKNPEGVFLDKDGELYICDTGNSRIIRYSKSGEVMKIYERPDSPLLEEFSVFAPSKLVVDKSKNLYVVSRGINMGILQLDENGILDKFVGAPLVYVNPIDYFWKSIASDEQLTRMSRYVPTEYKSIHIDHDDFIYAVTDSVTEEEIISKTYSRDITTNSAPIKRLTLSGEDVLDRQGFFPPVGDIKFPVSNQDFEQDGDDVRSYISESERGPSSLLDVVSTEYGIYGVLDGKRGKVFIYDYEGNLLFVFGGKGAQRGTFLGAASIGEYNNKFYVLDRVTGSITEFVRTKYGTGVLDAINYYNNSEYDKSLEEWNNVITRDSNSEMAYLGIGKIYLMRNEYNRAMEYFKLANNRDYYSKALKLYKNEELGTVMGITIFTMIALGLMVMLLIKVGKTVSEIRSFGKLEVLTKGETLNENNG